MACARERVWMFPVNAKFMWNYCCCYSFGLKLTCVHNGRNQRSISELHSRRKGILSCQDIAKLLGNYKGTGCGNTWAAAKRIDVGHNTCMCVAYSLTLAEIWWPSRSNISVSRFQVPLCLPRQIHVHEIVYNANFHVQHRSDALESIGIFLLIICFS